MSRKEHARNETLAMKVLAGAHIQFEAVEFPATIHDAVELAAYTGIPPEHVFKTLVAEASDRRVTHKILAMVPASSQLDLKQLASVLGFKKVQMTKHEDAERITGLMTGGISALALLNREFTIVIDDSALSRRWVLVSAGKRGLNLRLAAEDLIRITGAQVTRIAGHPESTA